VVGRGGKRRRRRWRQQQQQRLRQRPLKGDRGAGLRCQGVVYSFIRFYLGPIRVEARAYRIYAQIRVFDLRERRRMEADGRA